MMEVERKQREKCAVELLVFFGSSLSTEPQGQYLNASQTSLSLSLSPSPIPQFTATHQGGHKKQCMNGRGTKIKNLDELGRLKTTFHRPGGGAAGWLVGVAPL
jgi:hypothetical protein